MRLGRWEKTVLTLCRRSDPDRAPKFQRVCGLLGCRGFMEDLDDSCPLAEIDQPRDIAPVIERHLRGRPFDLCLAHGENGEYGHLRHKQANAAVLGLWARGRLNSRRLWTFALDVDLKGNSRAAERANLCLKLNERQLEAKRKIVRDVYGFSENSFELRACSPVEAFWRQESSVKVQTP